MLTFGLFGAHGDCSRPKPSDSFVKATKAAGLYFIVVCTDYSLTGSKRKMLLPALAGTVCGGKVTSCLSLWINNLSQMVQLV